MSSVDIARIQEAIRAKYAEVAISADGRFKYPTGRRGAEALGYDKALLDVLPPELLTSFCGVGNPFAINTILPGSVVLDIGNGAGFDVVVAARLAGPDGFVHGIDLTEEMVARARKNLAAAMIDNARIHHVNDSAIPFADSTFDVVISNGVINLVPDKENIFQEIFRVLKPSARLQFADIVLETELPPHLVGSLEAWAH